MRPAPLTQQQRECQRCAREKETIARAAQLIREALSLMEGEGPISQRFPEARGGEDRLLRLPEVLRLTGMCRSALYSQMAQGTFPSSVKIGERASSWSARAVHTWITERVDGRRAGPGT